MPHHLARRIDKALDWARRENVSPRTLQLTREDHRRLNMLAQAEDSSCYAGVSIACAPDLVVSKLLFVRDRTGAHGCLPV